MFDRICIMICLGVVTYTPMGLYGAEPKSTDPITPAAPAEYEAKTLNAEERAIAQVQGFAAKHLAPDIAKIVPEYSRPLAQWIPVLDEQDGSYRLKPAAIRYQSFYVFQRLPNGLQVQHIETNPQASGKTDQSEHIDQLYGRGTAGAIKAKFEDARIIVPCQLVESAELHARYGVDYTTIHMMKYFGSLRCKIVQYDSDEYQQALARSPFLLAQNMSSQDLLGATHEIYVKLKNKYDQPASVRKSGFVAERRTPLLRLLPAEAQAFDIAREEMEKTSESMLGAPDHTVEDTLATYQASDMAAILSSISSKPLQDDERIMFYRKPRTEYDYL